MRQSLYSILAEPVPAGSMRGETRITRQIETVDEAPAAEMYDLAELSGHAVRDLDEEDHHEDARHAYS